MEMDGDDGHMTVVMYCRQIFSPLPIPWPGDPPKESHLHKEGDVSKLSSDS